MTYALTMPEGGALATSEAAIILQYTVHQSLWILTEPSEDNFCLPYIFAKLER